MSKTESVMIVGAGIVGIACAHYLRRAGFKVTIIDKGIPAQACSHANCGYICPSHILPLTAPGAVFTALKSLFDPHSPFRVKPNFSPDLWYWMFQFGRRCQHETMIRSAVSIKAILDASMIEYRKLISEGIEAEWRENGLLFVLQTKKGMEDFARTDALLSKFFHIHAKRIEGNELHDFDFALRSDLAGAFFYEDDVQVRPDVLNRNWIRSLKMQGVEFVSHCALQSIHRRGSEILTIQTSRGEMRAQRYVFAMGAWSKQLGRVLRFSVPVQPGKGYSITMQRPFPCPKHPLLFPEHRVGVTPFETGYRLGSMMEFAGYDECIPPHRVEQLRRSAEFYLVNPHAEKLSEKWFGWRPMTWDSLPIIGMIPKLKNAFLATGHNMLGLSMAPSTGRLIKEIICGEATHIGCDAFRADRF